MKTAIVTGLRGQDGSYLADHLIEEGYKVYGMIRRSSQGLDLGQARHLDGHSQLEVVEGDITDLACMSNLCKLAKPDLFFNMAAQSHVGTSFSQPAATLDITGKGVLNCLEAIRQSGIHTRFLQASTSEMFGGVSSEPANEKTAFYPKSPYGCAKLYAHWITTNYRESYKMFASTAICFNHESPRRGSNFVTQKIIEAAVRISTKQQEKLYLGNLDAKRDWGHAADYTRGMILVLKHNQPDDFVFSTGETRSVREFCELTFSSLKMDYRDYVEIDPQFYRPAEVNVLIGDSTKAREVLGWERKYDLAGLVDDMLRSALSRLTPPSW